MENPRLDHQNSGICVALKNNVVKFKIAIKQKMIPQADCHIFCLITPDISIKLLVIARCRVQYGKYFPSFSCFATFEIIAKNEKRGKYLSILHEATCDNYFIIKCLLKSNVVRVILLGNFIELV